jgi:formate/nitrite transporter
MDEADLMDYVTPHELTAAMVDSGAKKSKLPVSSMLLRGALSGAILGFATTLADTATVISGDAIVGAVLFPIGFIIIVLLNLELVTGAFALLPVAGLAGRASAGDILKNIVFVYIGNLIGALFYAAMFAAVNTKFFTEAPDPVGMKVAAIALAKVSYAKAGIAGWLTCFTKAILCNWFVCLGTVMGLVSRSVIGKAIGAWMPIMAFFAQGFEHCVVNMFAVPCGIFLGAPITWSHWIIWNQIPGTLGNLVGGACLTGIALYATYSPAAVSPLPAGALSPAE